MRAFQARMTDEEYSKVGEMALAEGLSMSEYVRRKLFDSPGGMVFDVKGRRRRDKVAPLPEFTELAVPAARPEPMPVLKTAIDELIEGTLRDYLGIPPHINVPPFPFDDLGENHE